MTLADRQTTPATDLPDDDFDAYLADRFADPQFAAAYADAAVRSRLISDLVACRKAHGLRQKDIAAHMSVVQSVVSEFERRDGDVLLSTLQRYARAVGAQISCKIEMPAEQRWAAHLSSRRYQRPTTTMQSVISVTPPKSAWLKEWAGQARTPETVPAA